MKKTTFQLWNEGTLTNLGSFQTLIFQAFRIADHGNMIRLVEAFPDWFKTKY